MEYVIYSLRHAAGHQLEPALAGSLMIQYPAQSYLLDQGWYLAYRMGGVNPPTECSFSSKGVWTYDPCGWDATIL